MDSEKQKNTDRKKQESQLDREFDWFLDNLTALAQSYRNKFVVVKDFKVIGSYNTYASAINETIKKEELGTFIVQKCSINPADMVSVIHSPGVII